MNGDPSAIMTTSTTIDAKNVNEIWKSNFIVNVNNNHHHSASVATATSPCNGGKMADLQLAQGVKTCWAVASRNNNANGLTAASKRDDSDSNSADSADCKIDLGQDANDAAKDNSPAHHARRPMNAFLIFCKKHRPIVRKIHPTLENRGVTRILGEWWSLLDGKDKDPYTRLAKQYKDAFFSANPDFKWYKLPAPPLRTLPTRPTRPEASAAPLPTAPNSPAANVIFTPGKLADESQLGMLSALFTSSQSGSEPAQSRHGREAIPTRDADTENLQADGLEPELDEEADPTNGRKSHRKGKGNRYADIMANGRLIKNKRVSTENKATSAAGGETGRVKLDTTIRKLQDRLSNSSAECAGSLANSVASHARRPDATRTRTCSEFSEMSDVADYSKAIPSFDLDARIAQLPHLAYDAYVQRKKETKKRKLPKGAPRAHKQHKPGGEQPEKAVEGGRRANNNNNNNKRRHDAPAAYNAGGGMALEKQTGSKKRKNKHNITHLKNNTAVNAYDKLSDMSGLDTLAEIASNLSNNNDNNCSSLNNNACRD